MGRKLAEKLRKKKEAKILIPELFQKAGAAFKSSPKLANDYARKARNLSMKYKIRLPRELKRGFCKHCYCYLKPGENCRVRLQKGKVVYYCLSCREYTRFPYNREKKSSSVKNRGNRRR